ncbi:MAG: L-2-amino-thiazoline-4-carboxylic acid hydrolase [Candidatus Thorarchaeota archaeon]
MPVKLIKDYYIKRKPKIMRNFAKDLEHIRKLLRNKFTEVKIDEMLNEMKMDFEKILPEIPYIGGIKNTSTSIMVESMSSLAMFRVLEREGLTLREIGEIFYELCDLSAVIRKENFSKIGVDPATLQFDPAKVELTKKRCEISRLKDFPDDSVMDFVDGEGKSFEWGLNVYECGIHKAFKKLGAEKYVHLICLADYSAANIFGYGFTRTQSIGFGASMCDHRYIKNYKTPKGWPPDNLQEYQEIKV